MRSYCNRGYTIYKSSNIIKLVLLFCCFKGLITLLIEIYVPDLQVINGDRFKIKLKTRFIKITFN